MPKVPQGAKRSKAPETPAARPKGKAPVTAVSAPPKLYSSFLPLPLSLPSPIPIPAASSSKTITSAIHYIYARPHHSGKKSSVTGADGDDEHDSSAEGRTVFVVNLPVDMTDRDLRAVFARWGVVESVQISGAANSDLLEDAVLGMQADESEEEGDENDEGGQGADEAVGTEEEQRELRFQGLDKLAQSRAKRRRRPKLPPSVPDIIPLPALDPRQTPYGPSGLRTAHVTYVDPISLTRLFASKPGTMAIPSYAADSSNPSGLSYYTSLYDACRPSLAAVKAFADSALARYDHLHGLLLKSRAKKQGAGALVDEDGFTVVVRSGRYGRTGGRGTGVNSGVGVASSKVVVDPKKKGRGAGELVDFYRFQKADRKRKGESGSLLLSRLQLADQGRDGRPSGAVRGGQGKSGRDEEGQTLQALLAIHLGNQRICNA